MSAFQGDNAVAAERFIPGEGKASSGGAIAVVADLRAVDVSRYRRRRVGDRLLYHGASGLPGGAAFDATGGADRTRFGCAAFSRIKRRNPATGACIKVRSYVRRATAAWWAV